MAWIEVHEQLRDHPKVTRLAGELGVSKAEARGYVVGLWLYCAAYAKDGDVTLFTDAEFCAACDAPEDSRVWQAMIKHRLIDVDDLTNNMVLHDWHEHGLKLLKSQQERKERYNEKHNIKPAPERSQNVPVTSTNLTIPYHTLPTKPNQPTEEDISSTAIDISLEEHLLQQWGREGRLGWKVLTDLVALGKKHGKEKLYYAISEAARMNKKSPAYVSGILEPKSKQSEHDRVRAELIQREKDREAKKNGNG
jgi:hypothetical protein